MYKLFVVFALVGAIIASPTQHNESSVVSDCLNEILETLESADIPELAEVISNTRETFAYLIQRHRRCQELPRDDPPTRPQEIAIATCENAWRLSVAIELARLSAAISGHFENGRDLVAQFRECSGISLPETEPSILV